MSREKDNNGLLWAVAILVVAFLIPPLWRWLPEAMAKAEKTTERQSGDFTRACNFPDGGWTAIDCSAGAANNATALTPWARYVIQCVGDSHIAWGDASGEDADANDGYLPGGSWLEFMTDDTDVWVSCDSAVGQGDGGKCFYIECE